MLGHVMFVCHELYPDMQMTSDSYPELRRPSPIPEGRLPSVEARVWIDLISVQKYSGALRHKVHLQVLDACTATPRVHRYGEGVRESVECAIGETGGAQISKSIDHVPRCTMKIARRACRPQPSEDPSEFFKRTRPIVMAPLAQ